MRPSDHRYGGIGRTGPIRVVLGLLLASLLPGAAGAAVEITPFAGIRLGGVFTDEETEADFEFDDSGSFGVVLAFEVEENSFVEVYVSRQETELIDDDGIFTGSALFDLDVDYYQVGGRFEFEQDKVFVFMTGTLGVTYMNPEPSELSSETKFSVSLGGGVRIPIQKHLSVRLEGRGFLTFMSSSSEVFCSDGQCLVNVESSLLWQAELSAGLTISF